MDIKAQDIIAEVRGLAEVSIEKIRGDHGKLTHESQMAELQAIEKKQLLSMRKNWSKWMLFCVVLVVVWDLVVIALIGLGAFEFKNNLIVPSFIAESIIKVLGLALIIVKFLFKKHEENSPPGTIMRQ